MRLGGAGGMCDREKVSRELFTKDENWVRVNDSVYFRHANKKCELRFHVRQSLIPGAGFGLFAARPYGTGETLLYYAGVNLGAKGTAAAERKLRKLCEGESGRYVMQIGSDYVLCYGVNNPAGLANDAGSRYANVRELASGRMIANRGIETGEEIYWCYGSFYWRRWKPRLPLYPGEEGEDGAEEGEGGEGGETTDAAPRCRVAARCE